MIPILVAYDIWKPNIRSRRYRLIYVTFVLIELSWCNQLSICRGRLFFQVLAKLPHSLPSWCEFLIQILIQSSAFGIVVLHSTKCYISFVFSRSVIISGFGVLLFVIFICLFVFCNHCVYPWTMFTVMHRCLVDATQNRSVLRIACLCYYVTMYLDHISRY